MHLRKLKLEDAPLMLAWMHDPGVVANMRTDFTSKTLADCEAFIRASWGNRESIHLAIASDSDEYMGTVSLTHIEDGSSELAIVVRAEAMNRGYAWFGLKTILVRAFSEYGLECVYWCVPRADARAVRLFDEHHFSEVVDVPEQILSRYRGVENLKWYSVLKGDRSMSRMRLLAAKLCISRRFQH
jgi:RimJ/RimL family protein N-acetyltransferase